MSCNNTNSTCSNCSNNYSSCNNKCTKCGCRDSFLTSPPPCPTPAGCPDPIPCQEVLSSDCIIYNGPDISCNGDVLIYQDSTWTELLEDLVEYFCSTYSNVPEILCSADVVVIDGSSVNEALEQIVEYFCAALVNIQPTTANNGLTMSTIANVQLGGPLIQNTTLTNSTFALNINSTTVPALTLDKTGSTNATLIVNNTVTSSPAILANSNISGFGTPVVQVTSTNTTGLGTQALGLISNFNSEQISVPLSTIPTLLIQPTSTTAAGTANACGIRVENKGNTLATSGVSIEFANTAASTAAVLTNRLVSETVLNSTPLLTTSQFIIQGKPTGTLNPTDQLTLKSTGQLQLNNYGTPNNFAGTAAWSLSTDVFGNVIQTTGGLFGTAFRGYISPDSFPFKTFNKTNSNISLGDNVVFDTTNGVIQYQIKDGVNFSQYNQTTGIWTCPQTGKYDFNYNVYLSSPANTYGWGEAGGTFTIGITDITGAATIYCADTFTAVRSYYYDKIYMTGGMQGVTISVNTQIVLKIQNLTGVAYTQLPSRGDNIEWAIRRVG